MRKLKKLWRQMPPWMELSLVAIASIVLVALGSAIVWAILVPLPTINNFENRKIAESTKIFDRTGNIVLYDVHGSIRRTSVPLEEISPYLQNATIAIEDTEFYSHKGFRPVSFIRAMLVNLQSGSFKQGGSTITQQVVKNALLTQRKTIGRKIEEIILALRLERVYTKDQILQTYLNETSYGGTIYGVEEASQYFFGVSAKDIDLAQSAYLAALPQAPTRYSPYGNNRDELEGRKNYVLKRMRDAQFISEEEYQGALAEEVSFRDEREAGIKAPHFVFYVREYLEEKYGADEVANGGLRVISTLDYELQKRAEEVIAGDVPLMEQNFNAENAGLVAIEPKSGQILTMVGSRGYFDEDIDGAVNITTSYRQPGSSFKPFVYATAFKKGYTPETMVFDLKTQFSTLCAPDNFSNEPPCYSPENFDSTFKGPLTLRSALAQSVNVASVKTLYLAGIKESIETARDLGITTLEDSDRYGLTLVLGGGEVTLLELTGAYGVFANDGVKNPPTGILRIEDRDGNIVEEYADTSERVIDREIARKISNILSDEAARAPEFGSYSPLYFAETNVADKTGTTNDYRDVWIVGYTPGVVVGAWAGNNDNSPMVKRIAAFIIAPMWHKVMAKAIEKYPAEDFAPPAPDNVDALPPVLRGNWNTNPSEGVHEILHWVGKENPRGDRRTSPRSDPQYERWEYPVALWAGGQMFGSGAPGSFRITSPAYGAAMPALTPIVFSAEHPQPQIVSRVSYYVNGAYVGDSSQPPYSVAFIPQGIGSVQLKAVAETTSGPQETDTSFTIQ